MVDSLLLDDYNVSDLTWLALRVILIVASPWYMANSFQNMRFYAGVFTASLSALVIFAYATPPFETVHIDLASLCPYMLAVLAAASGFSMGVLLPNHTPGYCLGLVLSLYIGTAFGGVFPYFRLVAIVLVSTGLLASIQLQFKKSVLAASTVLCGGLLMTCFIKLDTVTTLIQIILGYDHTKIAWHGHNGRPASMAPPLTKSWELLIIWTIASLITLIFFLKRSKKSMLESLVRQFRGETTAAYEPVASVPPAKRQAASSEYQRDLNSVIPPMSPNVYNMFDPAELPPRLAEFANMVYSACEDLGNFFGFQDSSVRNQAEHLLILLSNHRRYMNPKNPGLMPPSPIHALHSKVFSNYMKWCRSIGVQPNFAKMNTTVVSGPPAVVSRVVDLVLFFCIWGEGANLRHIPECLMYLYHSMMDTYIKCEGFTQSRSLYAGHYVDHVVTPIYEVIVTAKNRKGDHKEKVNYDDINEFFWTNKCLSYRYSSATEDDLRQMEAGSPSAYANDSIPPIAEGLLNAPKTFLEKRSWLRGVLALNRLIEWHIVTFYLLAVIAFAKDLVWGWVYSIQVASGVFWINNFLGLLWEILEVWAVYPGIELSGTAVVGSVLKISARFLILVYQTLYLMWTFGPSKGVYFGLEEDANFWWWQYIWLSLLCMVPYTLESALNFYPVITTRMCVSENDYFQSFLNILYPMSRIYVGKEMHESLKNAVSYMVFWITMIAFKLWFSYVFEVHTMVVPTLELIDDYLNFPDQSFAKMSLLLIMRWTPQFLVYTIDMSIWYALWQAFAGTAVGLSDRLGDVRDMNDIRKSFVKAPDAFCRKMLSEDAGSRRGSSSNIMASYDSLNENTNLLSGNDVTRLQSYVNNLLDVRIQKWVMFSAAWNEVIDHMRQEDILSNSEREVLMFSRFDGFSQAIYLPVFQTAGVIENVLAELERPSEFALDTDADLFEPISSDTIARTAVSEVWELGSFVLVQLMGQIHREDLSSVMNLVLKWSESGTLSDHMSMSKMRVIISQFIALISLLQKGLKKRKPVVVDIKTSVPAKPVSTADRGPMRRSLSATALSFLAPSDFKTSYTDGTELTKKKEHKAIIADALRDQVREKVRALINTLKGAVKKGNSDPESQEVLDRLTFLSSMENGFQWNDSYASDQLNKAHKNKLLSQVLTKVHGLLSFHPDDVEPKSSEARRRLSFFVNSLFMDLPDAPKIQDMMSMNVMTPFYSEDVIYSQSDLEKTTDALGVSTLLYLQTLYKDDWKNFLERLGITDESKVFSKKNIQETRLWASLRAQTLARTVNGMMYYEKALRLLANLERQDDDTTDDLMGEKFGYIVACQIYGNMKRNQDPKADDIEYLMHRYPHMRVAYIDSVRLNRAGSTVFFSVLLKSDDNGTIQEVYRVRVPGNPVVGEGKPENQNHAIIFSRSECIQTIDMNQEGYFEEALKLRNALQEFSKRDGPLPMTILGLREHIFTGSVSSLANYMALQETSFVTLGQRVLARPLRIRFHYGHPDIFDKLFFMTRGGISKSSKGINLSEDIFAGYNNTIRGGTCGFKEYLQIGKGRDVGMSQIYKFEAKLAQGNAEQSLSRDVYRLGQRLDFFRLCSMYFGGIGHYFSTVLTILVVYVVVYLMAVLALYDLEKIGDRVITPMGTIQMLLGGLGLLQTFPLFATLGVERGWWKSAAEIFHVFLTGGPLHFMFHIQTKANYMTQTILVGGAKYRATGRGFVTQHTPFDEQFRFFASSHLYLGIEVAAGLILMGIYTDAGQYVGRTWSLWLASLSFLASPFWFNPLSFDWKVVVSDYEQYMRWMRRSTGGPNYSWSMWWNEENAFYKKLGLSSKLLYIIKAAVFLLISDGVRRSDLFRQDMFLKRAFINEYYLVLTVVGLLLLDRLVELKSHLFSYPMRRSISLLTGIGLLASLFLIFTEDTNTLRYALSAYYAIGAFCQVGLLYGLRIVKPFYFIHDLVAAHTIFIVLFVAAALQIPSKIQTWLLYHNALSGGVVVDDILRYAKKSMKSQGNRETDLAEEVSELRKIIMSQQAIIEQNMAGGALRRSDSTASVGLSSGSLGLSIQDSPTSPAPKKPTPQPAPIVSRSMSMSGMDVWGGMALGDTGSNNNEAATEDDIFHDAVTASMHSSDISNKGKPSGFEFTSPTALPPR